MSGTYYADDGAIQRFWGYALVGRVNERDYRRTGRCNDPKIEDEGNDKLANEVHN